MLLIGLPGASTALREEYARSENLAELERKRSGVAFEVYQITLLAGAKGDPLDRAPAPELVD